MDVEALLRKRPSAKYKKQRTLFLESLSLSEYKQRHSRKHRLLLLQVRRGSVQSRFQEESTNVSSSICRSNSAAGFGNAVCRSRPAAASSNRTTPRSERSDRKDSRRRSEPFKCDGDTFLS